MIREIQEASGPLRVSLTSEVMNLDLSCVLHEPCSAVQVQGKHQQRAVFNQSCPTGMKEIVEDVQIDGPRNVN